MESRHEPRYAVEGEAEVIVGSQGTGSSLLRGRILDLSTAGCYLATMAPAQVRRGTQVYIEFWVYGEFFRVRASSRFSRTRVGVGFTFIDMDAETRRRLDRVLFDIRASVTEESADGSRGMGRLRAG